MNTMRCALALVFVLTASGVQPAGASPITFSTVLTGDPRPDSPDNLRVNVSVVGDTELNTTWWTVDLDMLAYHPDARLNEFGFNLLGSASDYTFGDFNLPYTPTAGTLDGSGETAFMLTLNDPSGHSTDATNLTNLTFTLTKATGNFTLNDFLLAPVSCSNDSFFTCSQLGAHLQGLGPDANDSGVALGNHTSVPEPGTLVLFGTGLLSAVALHRRRKPRPDYSRQ